MHVPGLVNYLLNGFFQWHLHLYAWALGIFQQLWHPYLKSHANESFFGVGSFLWIGQIILQNGLKPPVIWFVWFGLISHWISQENGIGTLRKTENQQSCKWRGYFLTIIWNKRVLRFNLCMCITCLMGRENIWLFDLISKCSAGRPTFVLQFQPYGQVEIQEYL